MISERDAYPLEADLQVNQFSEPGWKKDSMNVFLVDDSVIMRQRLKRLLFDVEGVQVTGEAGEVQEATDAILKQKPDVVLLDIHLFNGSGIEVLQTLKKTNPAPAVIILTGYPYPQYRQKCLDAGADFFFVKSTEFDQVVPALKQLIQRARDSVATPPTESHPSQSIFIKLEQKCQQIFIPAPLGNFPVLSCPHPRQD
jgi:DNA-binding NarL/FixJ family response regulator